MTIEEFERHISERAKAEVPGLELPAPPRRFALYEVPVVDGPPTLYCWGAELPDAACAYLADGGHFGTFRSAAHLVRMLEQTRDIRLFWVDAR